MTPQCQYFLSRQKFKKQYYMAKMKKLARISLCIFVRQSEQGGLMTDLILQKLVLLTFALLIMLVQPSLFLKEELDLPRVLIVTDQVDLLHSRYDKH